ncbi:AAA family ATPase [Streptomyces sp. CJ_13]|uniref:helix-turn-helix transcriptional regulator n=1 Tax=Streptomyces sp. CJ_13 TaxID=2724943 RepID=UPI001BDD6CB5|nr:LuxR family transcriptional regulator [Streptomyces sp. CJ_13]MBT1187709.1 AAA family ATPase [Streptomyces sp. CJ_13]
MFESWPALPHDDRGAAGPHEGLRTGPAQLIGRAAEMGRITAALTAARAGRGGALFVTGEPGVGKTRLAAEALAAAAAAGMATARGRASAVGSPVPYRPLVEALFLLARTGLLPGPDALGHHGPVLARLLGDDRDPATAASHVMVGETVLRLLGAVGESRGCLLVLDDLHDADAGTLAVLEYLLDNIGQQPAALLLIAGRACGAAAELAARARQRGAATALDLGPLDHPEVRLLVAAELGIAPGEVCPELLRRAVAGSAGIPFVVKELVHDLAGHAGRHGPGAPPVPAGVADTVRRQAAGLGPLGAELLGMAALFGRRFPLPVLERALGRDHGELSAVLRAAVASYLITPDGPGTRPGTQWYAFRYRLAAEALLDDLGPGERAGYARRAVRALTALHPGLPGAWCAPAARLYEHAGDAREAVRLYGEAARREMNEGAVERALELLTRAHRLVEPGTTSPEAHATLLERLLDAVACSGRLDRVPAHPGPDEGDGDGGGGGDGGDGGDECGAAHHLPARRRAGLHARLSEIATLRGRPARARAHLDTARRLLDGHPSEAHTPVVDLAAAHVELSRVAPDRLATAAALARRAVDGAQRARLPDVAGRALLLLGRLEREQDEPAAVAHFSRARAIALARHLPVLRVRAEVELATVAASHDDRPTRVERARREALRMGLLPLAHEAGLVLALDRIRRCAFEEARDLIHDAAADAARLGLGRPLAALRLAEAVRCAHQGRRPEMREALERLTPLLDAEPTARALSYGLARAFCSLLEERHDEARQEFAQALAHDAENPAAGDFGRHGVILLLGVLDGRMGRRHLAAAARASAGGTRWNHQFAGLAHAVLLGREGRPEEATAVAGKALEAAELYPMARRLCLRLVARAAYEDGWGEPVDWLREAEEYFHGAGLRAAAGACRALLRGMGASVRQRRTGTEQVPPALRRYGITAREFEVARLVAVRTSNKDIAARLHISLRTVEKHVANLLRKTGHPNRTAFADSAHDLTS